VSPTERRDESLRNVEIPGRLLEVSDDEIVDTELDEEPDLDLDEEFLGEPAGPEPRAGGRRIGSFRPLAALLRLYRGQTRFDFVGRRRWWFLISGTIIVAGLISFGIRGFNFGIDFKGGSSWEISAPGVSQAKVQSAMVAAGLTQPTVEILGGKTVEVQADLNSLPAAKRAQINTRVTNALERFAPGQPVSISTVGPTWGGQVTQHALEALIAFFIAVGVYISLRFEPKMAIAAFAALIHDLLVTAGVYSLFGFQVTPDTVVAILTILGYSLYDTVVVFDRVRDNARGLGNTGRMTYSEMVNLSMNQTLARSINTSLVAIMPVFAVLVIGAEVLGAVTLQNYGVALLVGLLSGAYSSIFIASPILAFLKEREQRYTVIRQRLAARGDRLGVLSPAAAAMLIAQGGGARSAAVTRSARPGPLRPGAARTRAATGAATGGAAAAAPASHPAPAGRSRPAGTSGTGRPPPRPRKGGTKRGGRKRR
jgi:preprotein translocase subunit SecF